MDKNKPPAAGAGSDEEYDSPPSSHTEKVAAAGAGSNCIKNEVTKHIDEVPILDEETEVDDFIKTIIYDSINHYNEEATDEELNATDEELNATADVLDGFLHDAPRFIEILRKTLAKGSGNEGNTQDLHKSSKRFAEESGQGPPTKATMANSTSVLNELECAFSSLGASVPREKLRDIITTTKTSMLTDNPAQFVAVWGKDMNIWAKCQGGGAILEGVCPCCYLCGQRLLPSGTGPEKGGQPEMEHVVPCPVAYKSFPNMDTLRYYYPFILLQMNHQSEQQYTAETLKRVYNNDAIDGTPTQSLRASHLERNQSSHMSMRQYWVAFTSGNLELLKQLYNAINCGSGNGDDELNRVKRAFKNSIKNDRHDRQLGSIDVTQIKDGAFNRIFEYCFSVISIWLYELAYSHRWCNQTKWDVSLHDTDSINALINNKQDPRTKKSSRINTPWSQGRTNDPILNEIKERPKMKKHFKARLTPKPNKLPVTQERVMKVWEKYDEAANNFPLVSVCNFFDDENQIKLDEIKDVMWLNNLSRILRFTEIGLLSNLKYNEDASVVPRPVSGAKSSSGATSSDSSKKRLRCDKHKILTVDEITQILTKKENLLHEQRSICSSLTGRLTDLKGRSDLNMHLERQKKRLVNDIVSSKEKIDALNRVIGKLTEQRNKLDAAKNQLSPLRISSSSRLLNSTVSSRARDDAVPIPMGKAVPITMDEAAVRAMHDAAASTGSSLNFEDDKKETHAQPHKPRSNPAVRIAKGIGNLTGWRTPKTPKKPRKNGGTRRKRRQPKSKRTRRVRKSKIRSKRTRRSRKSNRKSKTRRRSKK